MVVIGEWVRKERKRFIHQCPTFSFTPWVCISSEWVVSFFAFRKKHMGRGQEPLPEHDSECYVKLSWKSLKPMESWLLKQQLEYEIGKVKRIWNTRYRYQWIKFQGLSFFVKSTLTNIFHMLTIYEISWSTGI